MKDGCVGCSFRFGLMGSFGVSYFASRIGNISGIEPIPYCPKTSETNCFAATSAIADFGRAVNEESRDIPEFHNHHTPFERADDCDVPHPSGSNGMPVLFMSSLISIVSRVACYFFEFFVRLFISIIVRII